MLLALLYVQGQPGFVPGRHNLWRHHSAQQCGRNPISSPSGERSKPRPPGISLSESEGLQLGPEACGCVPQPGITPAAGNAPKAAAAP